MSLLSFKLENLILNAIQTFFLFLFIWGIFTEVVGPNT